MTPVAHQAELVIGPEAVAASGHREQIAVINLPTVVLGGPDLEFGTVNVNNVGGGDVSFPYPGWKHSGLGVELGRAGLAEYLRTKNVRLETGYR